MAELWRDLRIGDKVRIVRWPTELGPERCHSETREVYGWLIETQSVLTIMEIDAWGLPYGEITRTVHGNEQTEYLAVNHDGLELA